MRMGIDEARHRKHILPIYDLIGCKAFGYRADSRDMRAVDGNGCLRGRPVRANDRSVLDECLHIVSPLLP